MPVHTVLYNWVSCSAKVDNLVQPICQTTSQAGFGTPEQAVELALAEGWTKTANGKDYLCPRHRASTDKPAATSRRTRKVPDAAPAFAPEDQ